MTSENKNGYVIIKAEDGKFLANQDMSIYGFEIILGQYDSPNNYTEHPIEDWPIIEEIIPNPDPEPEPEPDPDPDPEPIVLDSLRLAKASKIRDINAYDISSHVNGFYYNGVFMWLDRDTRASLRNTIESSALLGRETLNIWFGDVYITLALNDARGMLAVLELYATDCYNVTAQHRVAVGNLTTLDEVEQFDVTAGYPPMPEFTTE